MEEEKEEEEEVSEEAEEEEVQEDLISITKRMKKKLKKEDHSEEAEEAEERFQQHDRRNCQRDRDDYMAHHIGQDVPTHDAPVTHTKGRRRLDVLQLAQLQGFSTQQAAQARPAGQPQDHAQQEDLEV